MVVLIYIFALFSFGFLYKLIANFSRILLTKHYREKYLQYLAERREDFNLHSHAVKKLFSAADIGDCNLQICEPVGYGRLLTGYTSLFENMAVPRNDAAQLMLNCFSKAEGTFHTRLIECFSPLYWTECLIFLPRKVLSYLGVKNDGFLSRLFQILYWLTAPVLVIFRSEIYGYISQLISKVH